MIVPRVKPLSYDELTNALRQPREVHADQLLNWISEQNISVLEEKFQFLGKEIFRFQADVAAGNNKFYSFGRALNRKLAAVKASAEIIERLAFHTFTQNNESLNLKLTIESGQWSYEKLETPVSVEKSFWNSNGWAVDFSAKDAIDRAVREALERHILLYAYYKNGWSGFSQIDQTILDNLVFRSLIANYSAAGFSAGLAVCSNPVFSGVSMGYLCDQSAKINKSEKWEQAFYEAYDYLRLRAENPEAQIEANLIDDELNYFLQTPFNVVFSESQQPTIAAEKIVSRLAVIDLQKSLGLPCPFFAAVVHGEDLLPLHFSRSVTTPGRELLFKTLSRNGLPEKLLERHPIL